MINDVAPISRPSRTPPEAAWAINSAGGTTSEPVSSAARRPGRRTGHESTGVVSAVIDGCSAAAPHAA
jgi:hypothetical protein